MKLLTTFLLAVIAALAVYSARKRIFFALKTGAVVYVVLLFARLAFSTWSLADRWEDLVWPLFGLLVTWAVLWYVSTAYEQRRASRKAASASPPVRRAR